MDENLRLRESRVQKDGIHVPEEERASVFSAPGELRLSGQNGEAPEENRQEEAGAEEPEQIRQSSCRRLLDTIDRRQRRCMEALAHLEEEKRRFAPTHRPGRREETALRTIQAQKHNPFLRVGDMRLVDGIRREQEVTEQAFQEAIRGLGRELTDEEWLESQDASCWMKGGNGGENLALLRNLTGEEEDRRRELLFLADEVLSYDFSEHMLEADWIGENGAYFYRMTERAMALWRLYHTEKNKKFLLELPRGIRDLLEAKASSAAALKQYAALSLSRRGVSYGEGNAYEENFTEERRADRLSEITDQRLESLRVSLRIHLSDERRSAARLLSMAKNDEIADSMERNQLDSLSYHDFAAMIGTKNRGQITLTEKGIGIINNHYGDNLSRRKSRTDRLLRERLLAASLERLGDRGTPEVILGLKKTLGLEREGKTATPLTRLELREVLARVNRLSSRVEQTLAKRKGAKNADHRFALTASELFVWEMDADEMEHPTKQQKKAMKAAIQRICEEAKEKNQGLTLRKLSEHQLDNLVNGNMALLRDNIFEAFRSMYAVMESINGGRKQNHDLIAGNDALVKKTAALVIQRMACRTEKEELLAANTLKEHLACTAFALENKQPLQEDFTNLYTGELSGGTKGIYGLMEEREREQTREQKEETDRFVTLCEEMSELNTLEAKAMNSGITEEEAGRIRELGLSLERAFLRPESYERVANVLAGTRFSAGFFRGLRLHREGFSFADASARIADAATAVRGEEQREFPPAEDPLQEDMADTEKLLSRLTKDQQKIGRILLLSVIPSDYVREERDETARGIVALKDTLKQFSKTREAEVADVVFQGISVRLYKRTDQSLYAGIDGRLLPLSCNAATLSRRLEEDICANYRKFGPEAVRSVVEELKEEADTPAERVKIRSITVKLLSGITGEAGAFFDNRSLKQLVQDAKELTLQGRDPTAYVAEVRTVEDRTLINNEETKDLLAASLEKPKEERDAKVLIKKKDIPVHEEDEWYEDDPNEFTEDQKKVQTLLSELLFGEETWETEKYAGQPGKRLRNTFLKHQDTLFLMFENPELLEKVLSILPEPEKQENPENPEEEKKPSVKESVAGTFREFFSAMAPAKMSPFEYFRRKTFDSLLSTALETMEKEGKFRELEKTLDENVITAMAELQDSINSVVNEIFVPEEEEIPEEEKPENLPDPNEWFIGSEERTRRRKNRAKASARVLDNEMKKIANGQEGQGKFTRLVLERYFASMDLMDKRAMVSAAFRYGKPRPPLPENATEEEKERDERKQKCDWLGGLLKGAGPLLQKMLQGVPLSTLPKELQPAVEEMKSALAPIPEAVVQAQLMGIVDRSEGKITRLVVEKPLGAASVGQAFLCRLFGPGNEEGKNVVVKLLRPDVRNRMMREMEVMKQCAQDTDTSGGMLATYEGQLKRIEEELDLTIEAQNAFRGKVYEDKYRELKTVKLCEEARPTANTLVMEAAPGITVDRYLKEVREEKERLLAPCGRVRSFTSARTPTEPRR